MSATTKSSPSILDNPPKALTFDVFGTVVNWRETVTEALIKSADNKISSSSRSAELSHDVRVRLSELTKADWGTFAQEWRNSYKAFVKGYKPQEDEWRDIDTHHLISLRDLLAKWELKDLYNEDEVEELSKIWHFLTPWSDSSKGLQLLSKRFITSTLSNGNQSLLKDLDAHGALGFNILQSSEDFKAYKPHPSTYLGAAERMNLKPEEVAMVAAHLNDLKAARGQGFKTIYVERHREEDWAIESEDYKSARAWVDLWITEKEDGFVALAGKFEDR